MTRAPRRSDPSRDRIVGTAEDSLKETIYAGAGAGTGKTQALVERIVNLITVGGVQPENIAAVTFTVAAASELRQRVREELEERLDEESGKSGSANLLAVLSKALNSLDSAFVGTIHSFAQSLLREQPLPVGLPPVFELFDAVQGDARFDEEWSAWLDLELSNPEFSDAVVNAQRLGLPQPLGALRDLAEELHDNYDLVERIGVLPAQKQVITPEDILKAARADIAAAFDLRTYCTDPEDKLVAHLESSIRRAIDWIDEAVSSESEEELVIALTQLPGFTVRGGRKGDWSPLASGESSLEEVRALLKGAQTALDNGRQSLGEATVVPLVNAVSRMVLSYAAKRRSEGVLEFQDLLVLSSELLDTSEEARKYFQDRYTHILIDEFQDTDPLQLKLAMRLADRTSGTGKTGAPSPGALFVVGDGKQSIYRFRRADLTQLQGLVGSLGATELSLTKNYRSAPGVLNWVNAIFEPWMNGPDSTTRSPNQAEYVRLEPGRDDYSESEKPRVMIAGGPADGNTDEARAAESDDFAKLAQSVGAGEWMIPDGAGGLRKSNYRDLCVLMPRRTGLAFLEDAFFAAGVPYVLEGQAPIFESQTVHELSNNLVAIDDPTDQVAIVAALKTAAWGCSDQDLYEWAESGRKFEYARDPVKLDEFDKNSRTWKIAAALDGLAGYHELRQQISTPYLIEKFVRERRLREVAALSEPTGDRERLMDLLIEMSRGLQRSGTGSLREFVRWISRQAEAKVRVAEGALAGSEANAVRVMTIHAAKGLEFPIVALMNMRTLARAPQGAAIAREEDGKPVLSVKLGSAKLGLSMTDYADRADQEKDNEAAELVRLAYVGATRAREHLIVSVHRSGRDKSSLAAKIGELDEASHGLSEVFDIEPVAGEPENTDAPSHTPDTAAFSIDDRAEWFDEHDSTVNAAKGRGYLTPSQLADHSMFDAPKPDDNMESTERNTSERGRGGTKFGSAVHAVLQDVDFDDLSNLDDLVRASAEAHEVVSDESAIAVSVRSTLASPTVAKATMDNSWREAWVAAEISESIELEGSVDLIIQNDDGSVTIIDYKTDQVVGELLLERAKGYEPQLAGYVLVLEKLGMRVRDAVLVFANGGADGSAAEYFVKDMDAAKATAMSEIQLQIS
jgi:ATP-dependent helicase/nuclease subunit A